jgi:hypothetical protein
VAQLLSDDGLRAVFVAAINCGLDRNALLAGLPPTVRAGLPIEGTPAAQHLVDLQALNRVPRGSDGSVPLASWLGAADALTMDMPENKVFRDARSIVLAAAVTPIPQATALTPVPSGPTPDAWRALGDFLLSAFSADELRRFLRWFDGTLSARLPGPNAALATLVDEAVLLLSRDDAVDADFFTRLTAERPRRKPEIDALRARFGG